MGSRARRESLELTREVEDKNLHLKRILVTEQKFSQI